MTRTYHCLKGLVALVAMQLLNACGTVNYDPPVSPASFTAIPLCYNYGCATKTTFALSHSELNELKSLFDPLAENSQNEREKIARAIALLETSAGRQTPTRFDKGKNPWSEPTDGGLDCVDESTNTTQYLHLLQSAHFLRFHKVVNRIYRAPLLFDNHFSARILDVSDNAYWAVDSWPRDNGQPPIIIPQSDWFHKKDRDILSSEDKAATKPVRQ